MFNKNYTHFRTPRYDNENLSNISHIQMEHNKIKSDLYRLKNHMHELCLMTDGYNSSVLSNGTNDHRRHLVTTNIDNLCNRIKINIDQGSSLFATNTYAGVDNTKTTLPQSPKLFDINKTNSTALDTFTI
ncbi:hypothetical protein [Ectropis obliqua nucleopolyhedrovirus]|uniref:Uncharacterized protein n=1 Tax=Ectropis obliqua nucleopolyhedrovirus TaxID=59376 RepID=A0EZ05_9ABAC|nr:hypothetical protein EONV_gp102 [Ectropis obliqua nucleopolyhedrovirus]ABI35785.1 hypothetical protein [Ectropis obliqua nucleopolyhedrovirus]QWV59631.1 hypothetical protein EONV_gp102 [Ectropis obliqua nucleopolyhedrovirus]UYO72898.1 hypothetical protein EONV-gp102 [Ectropis obliqua nucleopolyhedrovirus]